MTSLPVVGDLVLVADFHNAEIAVVGVLNQEDLGLEQGEVFLFNANKNGRIKIYADGKAEIISSGGSITIQANGDMTLNNTGHLTVNTVGNVEINGDYVTVLAQWFRAAGQWISFKASDTIELEAKAIGINDLGGSYTPPPEWDPYG